MRLAVVSETFPGERRVAIVPAELPRLASAGIELWVERGAGERAGFPDAAYRDKGARVVETREALFEADAVAFVRAGAANPEHWPEDEQRLREGQVIFGMLDPLGDPDAMGRLAERGVTAFALELIPRITRAQSMDVLSSMATVAGYKAVLLAADALPKFFPMFMTAAGTVPPARVLVIGAGVAGLQAIATARRLGAVVEAYDVRPAVKEEVESLGARFVELELQGEADEQGYAKEQDEAFLARQRQLLADTIAQAHVVITTASIPGRKAPEIVTADMVERMRPGSVIVDIAAERGGNCTLTRAGERVEHAGVTILGPINLGASLPVDASRMYARNLANLLRHVVKEGELVLDWSDEITRGTVVCHGGRITHPRLGGEPPATGGHDGDDDNGDSAQQPAASPSGGSAQEGSA
ncbi:MAG: Re/Si-specific NAD(P)(+) transhydrogenase subunit alpha [Planctomycetota bacterium]|nr:MAG: Re/Si-specific NAD(P)(+) transhydrogenase subunit alpha [Planctomycetota bacterium]